MEYSELKEKTWIYFDNKYHFVQELNEGFILLAYSPIEYIPILKTLLPNDAKIVEPNKYVVNETGKLTEVKAVIRETIEQVVDYILDAAGNKGTGKWTSQSALDFGVPLPLITESVFARYISAYKEERVQASKVLPKPTAIKFDGDKAELIEKIRQALYFSKIMSYAQGFSQLRVASKEQAWNLPFGEIASIWRAGCIIRARFLQKITDAYGRNADLANLLLDEYFMDVTAKYQQAVRDVSFSMAQGEVVGLLGPNGAGKTTTIKMITGVTIFSCNHSSF